MFKRWNLQMGDVIPVELPGRAGNNYAMPHNFDEAVGYLEEEIHKNAVGFSWVMVGHSMGAYLGYECIRNGNLSNPEGVIFSGVNHFSQFSGNPEMMKMDDDNFIDELSKLGGIPDDMANNRFFREWNLPIIRNDLLILQEYIYSAPLRPMNIPMLLVNGDEDQIVDDSRVDMWNMDFSQFKYMKIMGDHFSIYNNEGVIDNFIKCLKKG